MTSPLSPTPPHRHHLPPGTPPQATFVVPSTPAPDMSPPATPTGRLQRLDASFFSPKRRRMLGLDLAHASSQLRTRLSAAIGKVHKDMPPPSPAPVLAPSTPKRTPRPRSLQLPTANAHDALAQALSLQSPGRPLLLQLDTDGEHAAAMSLISMLSPTRGTPRPQSSPFPRGDETEDDTDED